MSTRDESRIDVPSPHGAARRPQRSGRRGAFPLLLLLLCLGVGCAHAPTDEGCDAGAVCSTTGPSSDAQPDTLSRTGPSDLVADVRPADDLGGEPTADLSSPDDLGGEPTADLSSPDGAASDDSSEPIDLSSVCPIQTVRIGDICMDRWEAPNKPGARPLVMYSFYEAEAWCKARGKRLCYDDEWQNACEGPKKWKYPYGDLREPGRCNDDKTWLTYSATKLALWPSKAATSEIETLEELFAKVKATGPNGVTVVNHLEALYQAEGNGENPECVGPSGVEDLVGSVEEWTRRRDGGSGPEFSGNLKGRFWAESRTCQSSVLVHANAFRFYEIGFRCCMDRP